MFKCALNVLLIKFSGVNTSTKQVVGILVMAYIISVGSLGVRTSRLGNKPHCETSVLGVLGHPPPPTRCELLILNQSFPAHLQSTPITSLLIPH
jgi:hypothetical protein